MPKFVNALQNENPKQSKYFTSKLLNKTAETREKPFSECHKNKPPRIQIETPEERERRLAKNRGKVAARNRAYYARVKEEKRRQKETPEKRETRLAKARECKARRIKNETPEQREERLAKARQHMSLVLKNLTPEEKESRRSKNREFYKKNKEFCLAKMREYHNRKIQNETPEQRETRLAKIRAYRAKQKERGRELFREINSDSSDSREKTVDQKSRIFIKTEIQISEQGKTQLIKKTGLEGLILPKELKLEIPTLKEEQCTTEYSKEIIQSPEMDEKHVTKNHRPIFGIAKNETHNILLSEKSQQMGNKILLPSSEARQDIKQEPSNLPVIFINDNEKTIILEVKHKYS